MKKSAAFLFFCFITATLVSVYTAYACTRVIYKGPSNKMVLTARSMDWKDDIYPNIWVFPRGIERNGEVGKASAKWKAKYGSVTVSAFDIATTDGINEKGLVSNILWLEESIYPDYNPNGKQKGMSLAIWAQYALDNYETVAEAVNDMQKNPVVVVTANTPGRTSLATVHLAISDASGDSAIFEYIDGVLVVYHSPNYNVLTNSPTFDKQLAVNNYISFLPGNESLPGSGRSEDRFARAKYYAKAVDQSDDQKIATGAAFSIIRNCSVPYGVHIEGKPNLSSTKWRTVADQTNLIYYFEDPLSLTPLWIDLKTLDFKAGTAVKKLDISKSQQYLGLSNSLLAPHKPFVFMGV